MKLHDFLDMYTNDTTVCINDNNLERIKSCSLWEALTTCSDLDECEVISFGFYDNELCVRIDYTATDKEKE